MRCLEANFTLKYTVLHNELHFNLNEGTGNDSERYVSYGKMPALG